MNQSDFQGFWKPWNLTEKLQNLSLQVGAYTYRPGGVELW